MRAEAAPWCVATQEECVCVNLRPSIGDICCESLPNFLGQRQPRMTTAFARNVNHPPFQSNVLQPKQNDIARPEPQACEEQQDSPIAAANW